MLRISLYPGKRHRVYGTSPAIIAEIVACNLIAVPLSTEESREFQTWRTMSGPLAQILPGRGGQPVNGVDAVLLAGVPGRQHGHEVIAAAAGNPADAVDRLGSGGPP